MPIFGTEQNMCMCDKGYCWSTVHSLIKPKIFWAWKHFLFSLKIKAPSRSWNSGFLCVYSDNALISVKVLEKKLLPLETEYFFKCHLWPEVWSQFIQPQGVSSGFLLRGCPSSRISLTSWPGRWLPASTGTTMSRRRSSACCWVGWSETLRTAATSVGTSISFS